MTAPPPSAGAAGAEAVADRLASGRAGAPLRDGSTGRAGVPAACVGEPDGVAEDVGPADPEGPVEVVERAVGADSALSPQRSAG
ncbi:hypothetical protein GCM10029963_70500 [Micromonospora andamanensis]